MMYTGPIEYDRRYTPSEENLKKLELSMKEVEGLEIKVLKCPICARAAMWTYSDKRGHVNFKCKHCKFSGPINLGYFKRQKRSGNYIYSKGPQYNFNDLI